MTTAAGTPTDRSVLPVTERYTILGWLRRNLFSDLFNSLLTIVALAFVIFVARLLLRWVFVTGRVGGCSRQFQPHHARPVSRH